jgi:EAL domain-containing protein (putative c-di-GMP-specific phosphodiesterase class I)
MTTPLVSKLRLGASCLLRHLRARMRTKENSTALALHDRMMCKVRARGGAHVVYSRKLDEQACSRVVLEARLRHALECGQLELHYQPQQRLADSALVGFEALLRWKNSAGVVSADRFLSLAEASKHILSIGDWVIGEACRQAKAWNDGLHAPLTIAVNISPRQLAQPGFLERLRQHFAASGVQPGDIELEITEGMLMDQSAPSAELFTDLKALGVKLAIDHFGTGYSSLSCLKRFPIHKLKIDQGFVRELRDVGDDAEIVKAVISLGHSLGLSVIAEGVQTPEQAALLADWACDEIQGYHYGRPMPSMIATSFIERIRDPLLFEIY